MTWVYQEGGVVFSPNSCLLKHLAVFKIYLVKRITDVCQVGYFCKYLWLPFITGPCWPLPKMAWWLVACLLYPMHHHNLLISPVLAKCLAYKTYSTNVYQYFQNRGKRNCLKVCACAQFILTATYSTVDRVLPRMLLRNRLLALPQQLSNSQNR